MSKEVTKEFNFFEYHDQINQENIILSYKGPITAMLIAELSRDIRAEIQHHRKASKKVFSIFMELAQNVLYYSSEINLFGDKNRVGTIFIVNEDERYKVIVGNMVKNTITSDLKERCHKIKELGRSELRAYKRELRDQPYHNDESSEAGIGLVQAALTADSFEMKIIEMSNEYSFFVLFLTVQK
ncbi:SiaB family protein kinase [uncultured Microscilla sp.]|uniref:SiaB family protein kinase n=1 Tax=uncultured Microscilla sp. TaxID=432653 RepID=UPI00260B13E6|nr:SiaB family protein kinase [uncultured Microscilla sp.]